MSVGETFPVLVLSILYPDKARLTKFIVSQALVNHEAMRACVYLITN